MITDPVTALAFVIMALGLAGLALWHKNLMLYMAAGLGLLLIGYTLWADVSYALGAPTYLLSMYMFGRFIWWFFRR